MFPFKKIISYIIEKVYNQIYDKKSVIKKIITPIKIINPNIFTSYVEYVNQENCQSLNIINIINYDDNDYGYYVYFDD